MLSTEESKKCMEKVIDNLKTRGTFDELRKQCMADVDIKVWMMLIDSHLFCIFFLFQNQILFLSFSHHIVIYCKE